MSTINNQSIGPKKVYTSKPIGTTNTVVKSAVKKKSKILSAGLLCKPKPRPIHLVSAE